MTEKLFFMTDAQLDKQYAALENSIDAVTQEITDHKTMWGEDAIPSRAAQRQNLVLKEREHKDAMEMLQSLPMVDSEPVVTVKSWTNGSYWRNYKLDWHKDVPEGTKLYTSPQPLQPITAADITPAMHQEWNKIFGGNDMSVASPKDGAIMAAAYNAVIKHKGDTK